jgi:hypothetical protein
MDCKDTESKRQTGEFEEAVLHRVKEERNILHAIRRRKANWIGHILRRNCLLSHIIEGKISGTRRRGRRRKQLLDDLKEARRYWRLKEEAQDHTLWRTEFGRGWTCRKTDYYLNLKPATNRFSYGAASP